MPEYDFKILQFNEFECLCRDLLQKKEKNFIESFTEGRDDGIDLRFAYSKSHKTIIQVKRYKDYYELKGVLKKEAEKVRRLNPARYILMTSVGLTPKNKREINELFAPYILQEADIYGRDDINNLLGLFPEIERQYYKLWLSSYNIMEDLIHKEVVNYTSFEKENIYDEIHRYVHNDSFVHAMEVLNRDRVVIISGIPGIGKTTLARMLAYHLLAKGGYEQFVAISGDIDEGVSMFQDGRKQVFYYDDFLGSNTFIPQEKNFDKKLISLINAIKRKRNKVLILTTREYILKDALQHYQSFNTENLELLKCVIDLHDYTDCIRARILYNHLADAHLPKEYIDELVEEKRYVRLVRHPNFNPRVIEFYIDKGRWRTVEPKLFVERFLEFFDKPESVWESAFNDLSREGRYMLLVLATTGADIGLDDWRTAYEYFAQHAPLDLSLDPHEWYNNLKILENSFIKSQRVKTNEIVVSFINPSVLDFIGLKLKQQQATVRLLIQNCFFMEQLYTMFSEIVVPFYKWYCVEIGEELYPDVLKSFYRLLADLRSCARDRFTWMRKECNPVIFLSKIWNEYRKLCRQECLLEKTVREEWMVDSGYDILTRLELADVIRWEMTGMNSRRVLTAIGNEDLMCEELADYISVVKPRYEDMVIDDLFVQRVYDTAVNEIDGIATTFEADELRELLDSIFDNLGDCIDREELTDRLYTRRYQLEAMEQEETEVYMEERKNGRNEEAQEDERITEMFTSLRCGQ